MKLIKILFTLSCLFFFLTALNVNYIIDAKSNSTPITKSNYTTDFFWEKLLQFKIYQDEHLLLGNPSSANNNKINANNYLIIKHQYDLSYNNDKGYPNWVSWHLDLSWKGNAKRCNCFSAEETLPNGFFKASSNSYAKSGFDRGHLCPSEDRDANAEDNAATFTMSNMIPQSPNLNRITWVALEKYCQDLITQDYELYIIAGAYGIGGEGSKGYTEHLNQGKITVPASCWKIIVLLKNGPNDLQRINSNTKVIAVDMPNNNSVKAFPWEHYRTTIDDIEQKTHYDFLSNVPASIQNVIEKNMADLPSKH